MANLGGFNPDAIPDDDRDFDTMPDGWQNAYMTESDLLPTKSGDGQKLEVTFEIIDGQFKGRKVWERYNLVNANAQAQEIGQRDLKKACKASGHQGVLNDSSDLHFKPMRIRLGTDPAKDGFKAKNVIKGYDAYGGATPTTAAPQASTTPTTTAQPQAQTTAPAAGKLPWQK